MSNEEIVQTLTQAVWEIETVITIYGMESVLLNQAKERINNAIEELL